MSKETGVSVTEKQMEIAKQLNSNVFQVIGREDALEGFEKAFQIANATQSIKELLNTQYMKPIMALQGNRLGFKTDKDPNGYPEDVVKNCLIEAVLTGVQPFGNQFNIIAGNMYVTKEGFGELLKKVHGLKYDIVFELPRINAEKTSAAVDALVSWSMNGGEKQEKKIPIPVKMNQYMGTDAVLGKATRKARAWLFNTVTGSEVGDGDVMDVDSKVVSSKPIAIDKNEERFALLINDATTFDELKKLQKDLPDSLLDLFNEKAVQLAGNIKTS